MAEYIDREAAYRAICNDGTTSGYEKAYCSELIKNIPAADVAPVRHGKWERVIPSKSAAKWSTKASCSNCHNAGYTRYKYCPNCGCLMLGGED